MTHEYVIAYNGRVEAGGHQPATAIGWADEAVLAVGSDEVVRAISRGDSTFIDLDGCIVTPLPPDLERARALVRDATGPDLDIAQLLVTQGALPTASLEPGSAADMAIWRAGPGRPDGRVAVHLVASVRGGHFTQGDDHRGPFPAPRS